jgi:hypothetical protein
VDTGLVGGSFLCIDRLSILGLTCSSRRRHLLRMTDTEEGWRSLLIIRSWLLSWWCLDEPRNEDDLGHLLECDEQQVCGSLPG